MARNPYQAHLCAQDPDGFEGGFSFAALWLDHLSLAGQPETIHRVISRSAGQPWEETAARLGLPPTAQAEGFALGVYGIKALECIP
jgi:hypothetical protein